MAFGAILANVAESGLDKDHAKDQQQVKATGEMTMAGVEMEGDLGYKTAYYKNKTDMNSDNIAAYTLGAAAEYGVSKAANVGGAVGYDFGSDKNAGTKVTASNLTVAVRGPDQPDTGFVLINRPVPMGRASFFFTRFRGRPSPARTP